MTPSPFLSRVVLALVILACCTNASAEALIKPVPPPDLSKLSPEAREQVTAMRRDFDAAQLNLVGEAQADSFAQLAAIYARYGLDGAALAALANAIALMPEDGRYEYLTGVLLARSGDMRKAIPHLQRAYALDKNYLPIRYRLGEVALAAGDFAAARPALQDIATKRPELAPAHALLGRMALKDKRYAEAIASLQRALKADPQATSLYAPLADALAANGDAAGAATARKQVGNGEAGFADPLVAGIFEPQASDPVVTALALAAQGRHADARKLLDGALAASPNNVDLLSAYARVEADAGNATGARTRADAALKAGPDAAAALLAMGVVLEVGGQEPLAVGYYEKAVRQDLQSPEARLFLGNAYMRRQQYAAAAEQYRQMAQGGSESGNAIARLAAAQVQAGKCGDALRDVNAILKQRPRDGIAMQTFVRLASTCDKATPVERQMASDYGLALYKQVPSGAHAEALALALAANGKAKDAVDYEAQAMFEAVKANDDAAVARMKPWLESFKANRAVTAPWPSGHPLLQPPRLAASGARPAAPAPTAPAGSAPPRPAGGG
jgi:tetratricopeptide (TPR) repeat protein